MALPVYAGKQHTASDRWDSPLPGKQAGTWRSSGARSSLAPTNAQTSQVEFGEAAEAARRRPQAVCLRISDQSEAGAQADLGQVAREEVDKPQDVATHDGVANATAHIVGAVTAGTSAAAALLCRHVVFSCSVASNRRRVHVARIHLFSFCEIDGLAFCPPGETCRGNGGVIGAFCACGSAAI